MSGTRIHHKSIGDKSRARTVTPGLPLDPPPFFLEGEIRLSGWGMNISCAAVGLTALLTLGFLLPESAKPLPTLSILILSSIGSAVYYFGVRFMTYWAVWRRISGTYRQSGGRYLGANGELPKNAFLAVFAAPLTTFMILCLIFAGGGGGFAPDWWVAIAVAAGLAVRDLKATWQVLLLDRALWLKETSRGLDILKPVTDDS